MDKWGSETGGSNRNRKGRRDRWKEYMRELKLSNN